jgi:hypothetical protein
MDILYALFTNDGGEEIEAQKKLHRFILINDIQKALQLSQIRDASHPVIETLIRKAVTEIEECLATQTLSDSVRLVASICYAR